MADSIRYDNAPCPFCGLVCDDLTPDGADGRPTVSPRTCARAAPAFAAAADARPHLDAAPVPLSTALDAAAARLRGRRPLFAGMATDVAGARAVLALADRLRGAVSHMNGAGLAAGSALLQDSGWMATTLSEARNRADRVLLLGDAPLERFPRLYERVLAPTPRFGATRRVSVLDGGSGALPAGVERLACDLERVGELAGALRALVAGRPLTAAAVAGVPRERLQALAAELAAARYGVVVWAAGALPGPQPALALQAWAELVTALNRETRWSVLPLAGSDGDLGVNQVSTWQTGYPLPVSFAAGHPAAAEGAAPFGCDAQVWIASLDPQREAPDGSDVVLGHPGMKPPGRGVFIPVGVPGLDHAGLMFRSDAVTTLPLRRLRASELPAVAEVITALGQRLEESE